MTELTASRVSRLVTIDQKLDRVMCPKEDLELFRGNLKNISRLFVIAEEAWTECRKPDTKE